jgi:hypothetical protein
MPRAHRRAHRPEGPRVFDQPNEIASRLLNDRDGDAAQHLENLRVALKRLHPGLYVRLERPSGRPPHLRVMGTGSRTSAVFYRVGPDGGLGHYIGDRGQALAAVGDLEQAGMSVMRALGIRGRQM